MNKELIGTLSLLDGENELVGVISVASVEIEGGAPSVEQLENSVKEAKQYRDEAKYVSENVNIFIPEVSEIGELSWRNQAGIENPIPVNIMGPIGPQGETGPQGPKGDKGDKPIKGIDYFTSDDKQEIVNDVIASLPIYNGEVIEA